jgi:hypothetical protein
VIPIFGKAKVDIVLLENGHVPSDQLLSSLQFIIAICDVCNRKFTPALLLGFGTSSSAASMPVAMRCGEEYGCASSIVRFVIPMGTNINRDGAALYEAVSVMFICQVHYTPRFCLLSSCHFVGNHAQLGILISIVML